MNLLEYRQIQNKNDIALKGRKRFKGVCERERLYTDVLEKMVQDK